MSLISDFFISAQYYSDLEIETSRQCYGRDSEDSSSENIINLVNSVLAGSQECQREFRFLVHSCFYFPLNEHPCLETICENRTQIEKYLDIFWVVQLISISLCLNEVSCKFYKNP